MLNEKRLILDWTKAHDVCPIEAKLSAEQDILLRAHHELVNRCGSSPEMTGWLDYNLFHDQDLMVQIAEQVALVQKHSDAVVIIGIGGSFLGAKSIHEALTHSFSNLINEHSQLHPKIFWAGNHLATDEMAELLDALNEYTPTLIVISKSGATTEPAIAFRILKQYLNDRFGEKEADARVLVVTDPTSGLLYELAKNKNYPKFPIPKDIGGRYSVFTVVGLLPLAFCGISIKDLLAGAQAARDDTISEKNASLDTNLALSYAGIRNILYKEGYKVESLCVWTPKLRSIANWWIQLFAESDGKELTGILPFASQFSTDLHSVGQYFQQGERCLFATHIKIMDEYSISKGNVKRKVHIPDANLNDGFDYLSGKSLSFVQSEAQQATVLAHSDGQVPTLVWNLPELNAWWLGYWMYINMYACAVGNYARGIDPFYQPGVEQYKQNMFSLLGKPGFQKDAAQLKNRIEASQRLRASSLSFHQ